MIAALADGTLDCVATDHAPHAVDEKEVPFEEAPFGVTGLETAFAACHTHLVRTGAAAAWSCSCGAWAPTRPPCSDLPAPTLADGAVADLALIDLEADGHVGEDGFRSRSRNSAFLGDELVRAGAAHDRGRADRMAAVGTERHPALLRARATRA